MGEGNPYRSPDDKRDAMSAEERGRIIAEMIAARAGRAEAREEQRRKLLRPASIVATVAVAGTLLVLLLGNEPSGAFTAFVVLAILGALAAWNRGRR